jgi:hypothetical protein
MSDFKDYYRNPDGSLMFDDGSGGQPIPGTGPAAEAKARQIDAMRSPEDTIRNALAPRADVAPPPMLARPNVPEVPSKLARPPEKQEKLRIKSILSDDQGAALMPEKAPAPKSDAMAIAGALGVKPPETLPAGLKPATREPERSSGQVDPNTVRFASPQGGLMPPGAGAAVKPHTQEMLAGRQTQQIMIPDADKAAIGAAGDARLAAGGGVIDAQVLRAEKIAEAWREENANLMHEQQASQARMAEARAQYTQMIDGVRRMNDQVQNEGIHSYWEGKSSGERFVSAIAVGLGVFGAGLQKKQTNAPQQMLRDAMNDEMEKQKANLQNRRQGVAEASSLLGRYHEVLGDMNAAEAAARSSMLEAAQRRIDQVMKETESPQVRANGQAMLASIMKENAEERAKLDAYTEHKAYKEVQIGGNAVTRPFAKNDGSFLDLPGGISIKASSPEMATQWRQQIDNIGEIKANSSELRAELAKGPGVRNAAKVKMLVNNIATSLGGAKLGSSRMTGQGELENVSKILDTGDNVSSDVMGRTRAALEAVESTADNAMRRIHNSAPRYSRGVETPTGDIIRYRMPEAPEQRELNMRPVE